MLFSYGIHKLIVLWAEKNDILTLQSGVYLSIHDKRYLFLYSHEDLDKHINYKVWFIQLTVWLIINTISKSVQFMLEYVYSDFLIK